VVFAHEAVGLDAVDVDVAVPFQALQWQPALIAEGGTSEEGLSIITWARVPEHRLWLPVGRADWPYETDTDSARAGDDDLTTASTIEDRRRLATVWLLSQQDNLATVDDATIDRATRRRLERSGAWPRKLPSVRLVDARRRPSTSAGAGSETVEWQRRWVVQGHWRSQPYGPGGAFRRPQYVAPHVKGPDDKPLVVKDTVRVWRS
jgi:hypothetical protein